MPLVEDGQDLGQEHRDATVGLAVGGVGQVDHDILDDVGQHFDALCARHLVGFDELESEPRAVEGLSPVEHHPREEANLCREESTCTQMSAKDMRFSGPYFVPRRMSL